METTPTPSPPAQPAGPQLGPLPESFTAADLEPHIEELERAPARLRAAVAGLTAAQLDTPYRNWTLRQIVHHLPDSHLNCYVRFMWALTEERPRIKAYDESAWSALPISRTGDIELPLALFDAVHAKWVALLRTMSLDDFARVFEHPETDKLVRLADALPSYAWHCRHHTEMIVWRRRAEGWDGPVS